MIFFWFALFLLYLTTGIHAQREASSQSQCITPVILALRRLRQEDHKLKVNLGTKVRPCPKRESERERDREREKCPLINYLVLL
jgi:hypothetical protein